MIQSVHPPLRIVQFIDKIASAFPQTFDYLTVQSCFMQSSYPFDFIPAAAGSIHILNDFNNICLNHVYILFVCRDIR